MDDDQERKGRLVLLGMGSSRAGAAKDGRQATNGRSMCLRTRSVSLAVHALRQVTTRGRARVSETSAECQPVAVCFSASHLPANRLTQPQPRQELRRLTCSTTTRWPHQPSARSTHRTRQSRAPLRRGSRGCGTWRERNAASNSAAQRRRALAAQMAGRAAPVGLAGSDVRAGKANGVARGGEAARVAELGENRDRSDLADAEVAHQRAEVGLATCIAAQLLGSARAAGRARRPSRSPP